MSILFVAYSVALFAVVILLHYAMGRAMVVGILFLNGKIESLISIEGWALHWIKQITFAVFSVFFLLVSFVTMFVLIGFYFATWLDDQYGALGTYTVIAFWIANYVLGFGYPIYVYREKLRTAGFLHI